MAEPITAVVVERHTLVRQALCTLIASMRGIDVAGEAGDGYEALERIQSTRPDVVLLDVRLPALNGIDVTALGKTRMSGGADTGGLGIHG